MTIHEAQQKALLQLRRLYDEREAASITDWVMEHITGKKRIDRILDKQAPLNALAVVKLDEILFELATYKPIQYVLGEAWFAGMQFLVNEQVLIPRPETEELVGWIVEESQKSKIKNQNLLDIGTGSGCIPVSIKKRLPGLSVSSVDVSEAALEVAQKNADRFEAEVHFFHADFLDELYWPQLPLVDIIVSNPPYIKQSEQSTMAKNVLDFEPRIALFVPDQDALLFYRKIALFSKTHLSKDGSIFLEINESLGKEVTALYESFGYRVELRKDMQGKDRMARISNY